MITISKQQNKPNGSDGANEPNGSDATSAAKNPNANLLRGFALAICAIAIVAIFAGAVWGKYAQDVSATTELKVTVGDYTINKTKMQAVMRNLSTKPTTLKFVTGADVPAGLTNIATTSLNGASTAGIQENEGSKIGVYQSSDGSTLYIAPMKEDGSPVTDSSVMYAPTDCSNFLQGSKEYTNLGSNLTSIECSNLNTSRVTTMNSMFNACWALTNVDISNFTTTNKLTSTFLMFGNCNKITSISFPATFDTSGVTTMSNMFYSCHLLTSLDISKFNTSNVEDMSFMFSASTDEGTYETKLTNLDLSHFDTSKVKSFQRMFYNCKNLTSLNISSFRGSAATTTSGMFYNCSALTTIDLSDFATTSSLESISTMFAGCNKLSSLTFSDSFDTSGVKYMTSMFSDCSALTSLDLSMFNTGSVTDMGGMFNNCYRLQEITLGENFNFVGTDGYLPNPSATYITGADGNWYDTETGGAYTPADQASYHNNLNATRKYSAVPTVTYTINKSSMWSALQNLASSNPTSLQFVKGTDVPSGLTSSTNIGLDTSDPIGVFQSGSTIYIAPMDSSGNPASNSSVIYAPENCTSFLRGGSGFANLGSSLQVLNCSNLDTSKVNAMNYMFYDNSLLTNLNISNLNTSNVTTMFGMFGYCSALTSLDLTSFDTSKTTSLQAMFIECTSLTSVDLSSFNTSKVSTMTTMFRECKNLQTIYASDSFTTDSVTSSGYMFYNCTSLKGGKNTTFSNTNIDATYAHIDGGTSNPGYFTSK